VLVVDKGNEICSGGTIPNPILDLAALRCRCCISDFGGRGVANRMQTSPGLLDCYSMETS
jgi:hypothetical protein